MSNIEDHANGHVRYYGAQKGVVTRNDDPTTAHCVKAQIDGLHTETDWLRPMTSGGGAPQTGGHIVPPVGADVVVFFHDGDPNGDGWYMGGSWSSVATAGDERPVDLTAEADPTQAALINTYQFGPLSITVDMRVGKRKFVMRDDESADHFLWDLENKSMEFQVTAGFLINSTGVFAVKALAAAIVGRPFLPNGKTL